ncbi:MAG: hypothetical protein H6741_18295 [Alphaproteobacteria bacterium]|nr:hypothetical protein [Alphaproteobacteria bacterium]
MKPAPLIGATLLAACTEPSETPDPPSEEALEACEGQNMGDSDFDWSCCQVWTDECRADQQRQNDSECMWICNG